MVLMINMKCKKCGVELTDENQYPSSKRNWLYCCKKCQAKINKENYLKNYEHSLEQKQEYYKNNKKLFIEYNKTHKEQIRKGYLRRNKGYKLKVIEHYSNGTMACANPFGEHKEPYTTIEVLSIDHINGGGTQERIIKGYGRSGSYYWLIKAGFPEGFQVLCMNCQFIKRIRNNELGGKRN